MLFRSAFPPRNDIAQRVTWDLADVTSAKVYFEATDGDDGKAYAWLAFGRFDPALPELAIERGVAALGNRRAVAAEIARALKLASLEPQLAALLPAKANADAESRGAVARALAAINPAAAVPAIGAALADANEAVSLREKFAAAPDRAAGGTGQRGSDFFRAADGAAHGRCARRGSGGLPDRNLRQAAVEVR